MLVIEQDRPFVEISFAIGKDRGDIAKIINNNKAKSSTVDNISNFTNSMVQLVLKYTFINHQFYPALWLETSALSTSTTLTMAPTSTPVISRIYAYIGDLGRWSDFLSLRDVPLSITDQGFNELHLLLRQHTTLVNHITPSAAVFSKMVKKLDRVRSSARGGAIVRTLQDQLQGLTGYTFQFKSNFDRLIKQQTLTERVRMRELAFKNIQKSGYRELFLFFHNNNATTELFDEYGKGIKCSVV